MAQAAQILSLPVEKLTFAAEKIDIGPVMKKYDGLRQLVEISLTMLTKSPQGLKKLVAKMEGSDQFSDNVVVNLIDDFNEAAGDYEALGGLLRSAAARVTAVHQRLI